MKPLIGITSYSEPAASFAPGRFFSDRMYVSYPYYAQSILLAGGIPVNLPAEREMDTDTLADRLDGFLFCGGEDVSSTIRENSRLSERDAFEWNLLAKVVERRKPVLAICRGCQLINIFFGGSLINDIPSAQGHYVNHRCSNAPHGVGHKIRFVPDTRWRRMFGASYGVNSLHHQAIDTPAPGLAVIARAEDGIIEMVEHGSYPFMLGVQWHPEMLRPWRGEIFEAFIRSCQTDTEFHIE